MELVCSLLKALILKFVKNVKGECGDAAEAVDRTVWRAGYGRGFGPVVRQTAK